MIEQPMKNPNAAEIIRSEEPDGQLNRLKQQQAIIANLGQRALKMMDLQSLLDEAVSLTAQALEVERVKLLELIPDNDALILRAGFGWPETFIGQATLEMSSGSPANQLLLSGQAVIIDDLNQERPYPWSTLLQNQGVVSGLRVVIQGRERPLGLLGAYATQQRRFTQADLDFLQAVAHILAMAMERRQVEANMVQRNRQLLVGQEASTVITSTLDLSALLSRIAEQMGQAIDATSVYICDYDPERMTTTVLVDYFSSAACPGEKESDSDVSVVYNIAQDFPELLDFLPTGRFQIMHQDDPNLSAAKRAHMRRYGAHSILELTMRFGEEVVAYASLWESRRKREFTPGEMALCQDIGQQAAIAIKNARLYEQAQRHANELEQQVAERTTELQRINKALHQEIAERRQTEQALLDNEERFRALAEATFEAIVIHEQDLILEANQAFAKMFGYDPAEFIGKSVMDFIAPESRDLVIQRIRAGIDEPYEAVSLKKDGSTFIVEGRGRAFRYQGRDARVTALRDITERKRAEAALEQVNENLRRRLEELAALNRITQTVTSTLDFERMLALITEDLVELFRATTSGVVLLNPERTALTVVAEHTVLPNTTSAVGLVFPLADNPFSRQVIETRQSRILRLGDINLVTDAPQDILDTRQAQSMMIVPLLSRGQVIGTIGVDTTQPGREFTPAELTLAETVAGKIAGAIHNARLFAEEQRQRQMAESLRQVSFALNSSLDRETLLNAIFEQLAKVLDYDGAGLFLRKGDGLEIYDGRTIPPDFIGKRLPFASQDLGLEPFRRKKPVVVADVHQHPHWHIWPGGEKIRSWMGAPLLTQGQAIGVLTVDNFTTNAYSEEDAHTLQIFANQAALAIQNARLYAAAQREIAERKQTEVALAQARDEALAASRLKTELLAKVSHEFRTPLGAILGYAEMLQIGLYDPLSERQRKPTDEIIDSTNYLTTLVEELLDQAKLEAGQLQLNFSAFAPTAIIDPIESQMRLQAQAKGLALTFDIAANMPETLVGDLARLQQILTNLVNNAIKFTQAGQVDVCLYQTGQTHWAMSVADTGPGIPAEAHTRIFEPFGQVDGSMTRQQRGTGLGLSIVKQLTTLMGGEIELQSEINQGSFFTVILPLNQG